MLRKDIAAREGGLIDLSVRRIGKTPLCLLPFKKLKWVLQIKLITC